MRAELEGLPARVARHAEAGCVDEEVPCGDGMATLLVSDDGLGLPAEPAGGGHGLVNMARRAEHWGGTFELEAGPEGGTVVSWRVPIPIR